MHKWYIPALQARIVQIKNRTSHQNDARMPQMLSGFVYQSSWVLRLLDVAPEEHFIKSLTNIVHSSFRLGIYSKTYTLTATDVFAPLILARWTYQMVKQIWINERERKQMVTMTPLKVDPQTKNCHNHNATWFPIGTENRNLNLQAVSEK